MRDLRACEYQGRRTVSDQGLVWLLRMSSDDMGSNRRACARCSRPAALVTPEGSLCTGHALAESASDGDWIPLIPKDVVPRRSGGSICAGESV